MADQLPNAPSVLVIGSINRDLVLNAPRLPSIGENLQGTTYCWFAGGKGANQAVALARLGAVATLVGRTGRDREGDTLISQLTEEGVCTRFMSRSDTSQTGLAVVTVDGEGRNTIVVMPGANEEVSEEAVAQAMQDQSYAGVLLQLEIPAATVIGACRLAERLDLPVILDAGPAQAFPLEKLPGLHVLSPNESETHALTEVMPSSTRQMKEAAEILLRRSSARAVVLKLGARGAFLYERRGVQEYLPAFVVDAVDSTAAGDAFTAALTVEFLRTGDLRRAVQVGNAAGALAATVCGAQPSLPTRQALGRFCEGAGYAL